MDTEKNSKVDNVVQDKPTCCGRPRVQVIFESLFLCALVAAFIILIIQSLYPLNYSVRTDDSYPVPMTTKKFGIEFYVKSVESFDSKYPVGTTQRSKVEDDIVSEYIYYASICCRDELHWHHDVRRDFPTPMCDKIQKMGYHGWPFA